MNTLQKIHSERLHLGEGPVWDERLNTLYYVDILSKKVFAWDTIHARRNTYSFVEYVSCIALTENPETILIALESGLYKFHLQTAAKTFVCQAETLPNYRYNDGKVDWNGNWLLGSMNNINNGPKATLQPDATLYYIQQDQVTPILKGVTISNGIAFQQPYIYYIDTKLNSVRKFHLEAGVLTFVEEIFQWNENGGLDGMCLSRSGKLYIANWGGSQILVVDIARKKLIDRIPVPALNPSSCCFGGPKLQDLYITTSAIDDSDENIAGVYQIKVEDTGIIENKFRL